MTPLEQLADTIPPAPPTLPALPKACGCGLTFDAAGWRALALVGYQDDGEGGELELRTCTCGSTLAIELSAVRRG